MEEVSENEKLPRISHYSDIQEIVFLEDSPTLWEEKIIEKYVCALQNSKAGGILIVGVKFEEVPKCGRLPDKALAWGI